jgi:hypothetical protein
MNPTTSPRNAPSEFPPWLGMGIGLGLGLGLGLGIGVS